MSIAEYNYYTSVPRLLKQLVEQLENINETLKAIKDYGTEN